MTNQPEFVNASEATRPPLLQDLQCQPLRQLLCFKIFQIDLQPVELQLQVAVLRLCLSTKILPRPRPY